MAGSEEWHEATATLLGRFSHGSSGSRYFSLADSEFEDAASQLASELEPGARAVWFGVVWLGCAGAWPASWQAS